MRKNDVLTLTVTGMTAEGSGVGRAPSDDGTPGLAVFIPFTAVGDTLDCRIVKPQKQYAFGKLERLLTPSPDRVDDPGCGVYGRCGGCVYRHVSYEAELGYKRRRVIDAFARVGGLEVAVDPIVGADAADGYRNKAQYPVTPGENGPRIGFYAPRSHRVVEQHACALQPPVFAAAVDAVYRWMIENAVSAYDEATGRGLVRHLYIRQGEATGQVMVCLVAASGKIPAADRLVDALRRAVPGLKSVIVNLNRRDTNVILGDEEFTLWGEPAIEDELCGLRFLLSPRSFYQVNRRQAERLYALAADAAGLTGKETLLDLYCGTGTIGLSMASRAKRLIGVEIVAPAVEDARRNAAVGGVENAEFLCADAAEAAARLRKEGVAPDVIVVDPPRKGCDEALLDTMAAMAPSRIVYVSCDPATLARDCRRMSERGYAVTRVTPVDMFPRTAHVECVVLMSRVQN
ncbi:MAG: 23S rRNA (uracil(1939)-C(5))-methyltransferase RlmD [Acutalibacteraceae bacterium]